MKFYNQFSFFKNNFPLFKGRNTNEMLISIFSLKKCQSENNEKLYLFFEGKLGEMSKFIYVRLSIS